MDVLCATVPDLRVRVPAFPRATCALADGLAPLDPDLEIHGAFFPVVVPARLLHDLCADEVAFRMRGAPWTERAWFLVGSVLRAGADLLGVITRLVPAQGCTAAASSVAFSSSTWTDLHRALRGTEICCGWVHTHSICSLSLETPEQRLVPLPAAPPETVAATSDGRHDLGTTDEPGISSGLFLSVLDIAAARTSFAAPHQITGVLDSDAALRHCADDNPPLAAQVAFWGWQAGLLGRRGVLLS